jgi:hypothetical protein
MEKKCHSFTHSLNVPGMVLDSGKRSEFTFIELIFCREEMYLKNPNKQMHDSTTSTVVQRKTWCT